MHPCSARAPTQTLVLRNVPDKIYRQLKDSAAIHRRSMTQEAILSLQVSLQAGLEDDDASRGRASPEETLEWLRREV
ncbi:FitA-like ribbon-helix-helix domain-containing protein [Thiocapsa bogorovii]|uniref:FitA-like ribbon-helix-helix domain-containing protein n=1 Tax=Thiocapsa bogorovii TaxID=521689 RepID=UPI0038CD1D81